jgi:predicted esterase
MEEKKPATLHIPAQVRGRLLVREPDAAERPWPLLVGFHGYGQNAEENLAHLESVPGARENWLLCSIQALSSFYRRRTGDVVGSWMTSQDRQLAIEDNARYIGGAVARLKEEYPVGDWLVFGGFSQGAAMAYRAALLSGHPCAGVIALGGDAPRDVMAADLSRYPPVLIGRGSKDEWFSAEKLAADQEALATRGLRATICQFEGGHEWAHEFQQAAGEFLEAILNAKAAAPEPA